MIGDKLRAFGKSAAASRVATASRPAAASRIALLFGALYAVSQIAILAILRPLGLKNVGVAQTSIDPEKIARIFAAWDEAKHLGRYRLHFFLDFPHPLWYGAFMCAAMASSFERAKAHARWNALLILPLVAGAFDTVENFVHVAFLADAASIRQPWAAISGVASISKWIAASVSIAVIAIAFVQSLKARGAGNEDRSL